MNRRLPGMLACLGLALLVSLPVAAQGPKTERFQNGDAVSQEIIVRFRGQSADAAGRIVRAQDPDIVETNAVGRSGAVLLRSRGRDAAALLQAYARRPDVEYAEPNYILRASDIPNDPFFSQQWELQKTGQKITLAGTPGADIQAAAAWDITEGSRRIVVGMIDSGIEYTDPDLAANLWSAPSGFRVLIGGQWIQCPAGSHGFNAITRTCDANDDDGHGTHTAGIVGAAGNNGMGTSGVNRVASMMALKFLDRFGQGTTVNAIAAIDFALQVRQWFPSDANIRVLNASWGGNPFSQALLDEINLAGANGMLFVTAAGNDGKNLDSNPDYPASYNAPNVVVVAATDNRDQKASFSNTGAVTVDLGAPGVGILSTTLGPFHGRQDGTSASAAIVSGAAALVLSACDLNTAQLKAALLNSVDVLPSLSGLTVSGGRLNVNRAVASCAGAPPSFTFTPSPSGRTIAFTNSADFNLSVTPLNGFSSPVSLQVSGMPPGMSASLSSSTLTAGSSTMTVAVDPGVPNGNYLLTVNATGGGVTRTAGIVVTVGLPTGCALDATIANVTRYGMIDAMDAASLHRPSSLAEYCILTLGSDKAVLITMGAAFDSYLYLLSTDGSVLASNDNASGTDAGISIELHAGTYILEATSSSPGGFGNYSISVNGDFPFVQSVTPDSGVVGSTVDITITGSKFFGAPFQVRVTQCGNSTVSNVALINSTAATARLTLIDVTPNVYCRISVSTAAGSSNETLFRVLPLPPTITSVSPNLGIQGQSLLVTITGTNFLQPLTVFLRSPTNVLSPVNVKTITLTAITVDLSIFVNTEPGVFSFLVTTNGGTSNAVPFTIQFAPPVISGFYPGVGGPGLTTHVVIIGTSFNEPFQINTDPDITVTNAIYRDRNRIEAEFAASPAAAFGDYPVTLTTPAGTSAPSIFRLLPPPNIESVTPSRAFLGTTTSFTVRGTNLLCLMQPSISGTGITAYLPGSACSPSNVVPSVTVDLIVSATAPVGPRTLTLTGSNGTSNPVTIDIVPVPPLIQTLTPTYGGQGSDVVVTLTGTDLDSGTVSVSGAGVQAVTQSSTPSTLTATLTIADDAPVGARQLTVSGAKGVSDPVVFSVTPPTWPDLTVRQTIPSVLGAGFNETYTITVRNVGTKETTLPVTVIDTLYFNFTFVSAKGSGWTCSSTAQTVTCTYLASIPADSEISLELTIAIPLGSGSSSNTVEVSSPEDYNLSNNQVTATATVVSPPTPALVVSPLLLEPGQQGTMGLEMPTPFPHDIVGTLNAVTLSFASDPSGIPPDPALQFATGGQAVSYIIRANTLQAEFQGIPGPIGFQTGTLAGTLTFNATFKAGVGPAIPISKTVSIAQRPPTINSVTTEPTSTGFAAVITMFSTTRQVLQVRFQFNTSTPVQLSCGGVPGCSAAGSALTFDVSSLFSTWYAANTSYGSLATLRVPFNIQGTISGRVSVSLTNGMGTSNSVDFPLP